ncbi:hypothetical protein GCM10009744_07430 [Kribbella alba]|uniref:Uncharacterized protein n=1 Tax=Kribbella alba TaxID=190197 RepID=A0ABP4QUH9_9ACTN
MSNYKCANCGRTLPGAARRYCGDEACKRAAAAERQRAARARKRAEQAELDPVSAPAAKEPERAPEGPQMARTAIVLIGECPECYETPGYGSDDCAHRRARSG